MLSLLHQITIKHTMKTYIATIGNESAAFKVKNLKEAKKLAQLYKRMNKLTGKTNVNLSK